MDSLTPLVWFKIGSHSSSFDPPIMNFGLGESQIVELSPASPNQGAFFFLTYHAGSC